MTKFSSRIDVKPVVRRNGRIETLTVKVVCHDNVTQTPDELQMFIITLDSGKIEEVSSIEIEEVSSTEEPARNVTSTEVPDPDQSSISCAEDENQQYEEDHE